MPSVQFHRATYEAQTRRAAQRWAYRIGTAVVDDAKQRCPVDEGTLLISITHVTTIGPGTAHVAVGSPLPYAEYVHTGTGIYGPRGTPIVPVEKEALKFRWDGPGANTRSKDKRGWHFYRSVRGMKPNPFLADALQAVIGVVRRRTP